MPGLRRGVEQRGGPRDDLTALKRVMSLKERREKCAPPRGSYRCALLCSFILIDFSRQVTEAHYP